MQVNFNGLKIKGYVIFNQSENVKNDLPIESSRLEDINLWLRTFLNASPPLRTSFVSETVDSIDSVC